MFGDWQKKTLPVAIKLVAEVNAAAEKYARKQVLTSRHSIFAELEKMQAAQASAERRSYEPIDGAKFDLQANRTYTTLETGAELYSVKLADRVGGLYSTI